MTYKLLVVALVGLLLTNKIPYAATGSAVLVLVITVGGLVGVVRHRRRFSRLVIVRNELELIHSLVLRTLSFGVT